MQWSTRSSGRTQVRSAQVKEGMGGGGRRRVLGGRWGAEGVQVSVIGEKRERGG